MLVIVYVSVSHSLSLPESEPRRTVSSSVTKIRGFAIGAVLKKFSSTLIFTIAEVEVSVPSYTVNVKLSEPVYPRVGSYEKVFPVRMSVPFVGEISIA